MTSQLIEHAYQLGADIGPRPPATSSERVASAYCASVFEEAGLETRAETFQGIRSFGLLYIPTTAGTLLSALIGGTRKGSRALGAAIGALSMAVFYGETTTRFRPLLKLLARTPCHNVVAILRPRGNVKQRLVVVSNVDSSRSGWAFHPAAARGFRQTALVGVGAGIAAVAAQFLPRKLRRVVSVASSSVLANGLLLMIQRELAGKDVEGANDNASGAAVLLSLAESFAKEPLNSTEVWFVATAVQQAGSVGMSAFMERHAGELDGALFLGIDAVAGRGTTVRWITQSSMLETLRASRELVTIAEEVANEHPHLKAEPGSWKAGLDIDVAAARGQKTMSLMALTPEGAIPNWRRPTDNFENIDEDVLERSYRFALEMVRELDRSG